ncbi:phosphotransferase family protein [Microlunatus soli]|uniref:Phosphotransferase enzyme family protein n=1 Tax=Microlunatus soli TaxID=630515 RepID=A0A1H2ALI1_9ACTN|nr:aminoglycoside phosphotransferase family protein [Microlunatus soli]SDT46770.1 Phosphotransferase enzyme family protein [Microlunatus soli]
MTTAAAGPPVRHTHAITRDGELITKTFRSWSRGEPLREWRALRHLAETAPGLAPEPVAAEPLAEPPWLRMRVVPGQPVTGPWTDDHLDALAASMRQLWSVPVPTALDPIDFHSTAAWRDLVARTPELDPGPQRAVDLGIRRWIGSGELVDLLTADRPPILGQGDPQVGNMLYDAGRFRLVDFEDAGRSDLAFELANFAEHLGTRGTGLDRLADRFDVDPARYWLCRRLIASFWFFTLSTQRDRRNDEFVEQSTRLEALLDR